MIKILYPENKPSIKTEGNREFIFCMIRRRWIFITPEEWVRQNFLMYLTQVLYYPASLIAVEKQMFLGDLKKRFDIVVYNKDTQPLIVVECKEMNVPLTESVLHQALRYNTNMQAKFIVITNGNYCHAFEKHGDTMEEVNSIPIF